ncbi:amidohydrolase family protein [Henriciella sp. AS95]|uniref:amidohydrolase family protein n=1 Tax=Henriciella sp. AS95 TaxID=3135782 RepID=UPI0031815371
MTFETSFRPAARRMISKLLLGAALFCAAPSCVQDPVSSAPPTETSSSNAIPPTPGVSGKPPTATAQPGQSLPLQAERSVSFETDEGTNLSIDVSPSGNHIVFDMLGDIYLLPVEGGEAQALTHGLALDTQPVFSPDGRSILFLSDRSGAENLWRMKSDGRGITQISFYDDNPIWVSPEWSPDGKHILVSRFWSDRNAYELWEFNAAEPNMGHVVRSTGDANDADDATSSLGALYSPDGDTIYLASLAHESPAFDRLSLWQVIAFNTADETERQLAGSKAQPAFRPRLSPDASHLAYAERRANRTFLVYLDLTSGETSTLGELDPDSLQASQWHDAVPRYDFTPDGKWVIANVRGGLKLFSTAGAPSRNISFSAQVDVPLGRLARTEIPLEDGPVHARLLMSPDLSPNGDQIAFSALGDVYVADAAENATPRRLSTTVQSTYHPSWSPDDTSIAFVSWTKQAGGQIWAAKADGSALRQITEDSAFYTHPVFTPDGSAIIAVRSSREARSKTYMEFGQLRDADLIYIPLDGSSESVILSGRIGGTPHFGPDTSKVFINSDEGVEAVSLSNGMRTVVTQSKGPNWYFAEGPAAADDIRVSPDGEWALAQITQQLHLYRLPEEKGSTVDLTSSDTPHIRLTDIGADYFGWSDDGNGVYWTVGSTLHRLSLKDVAFDTPSQGRMVPIEQTYADAVRFDVSAPRALLGRSILLTGATLIPMDNRAEPERIITNADILLKDGKIASVGPAGSVEADASIPRVDLAGHYIIPGLIDAHYHVGDIRRDVLQPDATGLKTNFAYGITTLFDPSTLTIDMLTYQDFIDSGKTLGSRLFSTGPAIFDFNDFRSKAEVDAVLKRYRDYYRIKNLKQYRVGNRRVRQWLAQSAAELGMTPTTEGALSFKLGLTHIFDGYSGNEHALPPPALYNDIAQLFAQSGTSSTLTLMITHGGTPADESFIARRNPVANEKYARFTPRWFIEREFASATKYSPDRFLYKTIANSAHKIFEAGGLVGVGAHGDIPGLGTIWEIEAYVEGGWSPAEALWAATMGSAGAIARQESLGSLTPGKAADLVVLPRNPIDDIRAIEDPIFVMKNGHLYDAATLQEHALTLTE